MDAASSSSKLEEILNIQKLIDADSFSIWKFQVEILFKSYDLYDVVHSQDVIESGRDSNERRRKDAQAQKIIMQTIDKKHLTLIMTCESAQHMFEKLCFLFEKSDEQHRCKLMQDFFQFKFDTKINMTEHLGKLENLAFKLQSLGEKINEKMLLSKILSTLPTEYNNFITAWESTSLSEKTLKNLQARLISEEKRIKGTESKESSDRVAFKAFNSNKKISKCSICKKNNHIEKDCFFKNKNEKRFCKICKKTNHRESECYFKNKNKVSFLSTTTRENNSEEFIIDSGCTSHMTKKLNFLSNIEKQNTNIQIAKKNEKITSKIKGKIETETVNLTNVLYVPELPKNLISVNEITENNGQVLFTKNKVIISKDNQEVLTGKKNENGLYSVKLKLQKEETTFLTSEHNTALNWHIKLGHAGKETMKKMIDKVDGMIITKNDIDQLTECEVCMEAKQVRLPFNTKRYKAVRNLQILHTDVCGPITPNTWDGKKYMLTVLDDYSHFVKVYLLKNKNETFDNIKRLYTRSGKIST